MKSFCSILEEAASDVPEKPLFVFPETRWRSEETLAYGDLASRAGAAAGALSDYAIPGDRALLLFPTGAAFWEAFMGCLAAGVIAVPLPIPNLNRSSDLLAGVCRDCTPSVLLMDEKTAELLGKRADRHKYLSHIPVITPGYWRSETTEFSFNTSAADTTAFLQYTSGSTSRPKGVQVSHGSLLANLRLIGSRMQLRTFEDRAVTWLPHYHDMGLVGSYLGAMFTKITSWCLPPEEFVLRPQRWLQLISEKRATISGGPDFGYRRCVEKVSEEDLKGVDLSSWRVAFVGAEKIRPDTLSQFEQKFSTCGFREAAFFPCYGLGEATLMATGGPAHATAVTRHVSTAALTEQKIEPALSTADRTTLVGSGQTFAGSHVVILDSETASPMAEEHIGEVVLSGPSVTEGYFNRGELNATLFYELTIDGRSGRFLRTDDLGFLSAGELFITGRNSELMIIRGKNLHPEDIEERACAAHETIASDGAIAFSTELDGQEELVVAAELRRAAIRIESPEAVIAAVRQELNASFGVNPAEILLLRPVTLPRTTSGKLRRLALKDSYVEGMVSCLFREIV